MAESTKETVAGICALVCILALVVGSFHVHKITVNDGQGEVVFWIERFPPHVNSRHICAEIYPAQLGPFQEKEIGWWAGERHLVHGGKDDQTYIEFSTRKLAEDWANTTCP